MNRKDVPASPNHRKQITVAAPSGVMSTVSTKTLGRSQANAYTITTTTEGKAKTEFCSKSDDEVPEISTWLWDIDRPWEGFKPLNSQNSETVQNNTENNSITSGRRKATTPPRKDATEKP